MYSVGYIWNRFVNKIHGKAIADSSIDVSSKIEAGSTIIKVNMDRNSFCGYNCTIINCDIGAFCSLADNISIGLASHPIDWVSTSPAFLERKDSIKKKYAKHLYEVGEKTVIGNDVWIGKGAYIKAGVRIGNGVVIGMGSVVTKDVPDYAIVAGIPAKIVRMRFDDEQIKSLMSLEWWNWEDEKLYMYGPVFNKVENLLHRLGKDQSESYRVGKREK